MKTLLFLLFFTFFAGSVYSEDYSLGGLYKVDPYEVRRQDNIKRDAEISRQINNERERQNRIRETERFANQWRGPGERYYWRPGDSY
jgi:hypothetical protein